jgi:peroxidase
MSTVSPLPEFRPIGAIGNNLADPALDPVPGSPETKLAPANFAPGTTDGLIDGPNPRMISNVVTGGDQADTTDPTASAWLYAFGQFVDHDLDLEKVGSTAIDIPVPDDDPNLAAGSSIGLTRAITDPSTGTAINTIAGFLDLSQVYGSDEVSAANLRNPDGTLKTSAGDALTIQSGSPMVPGGPPPIPDSFVSGDARVNENPELTAITTMFMREHNYWVGQLSAQHPNWNGDQLYNMAKAITTAEYQNIIYREYLPQLIGSAIGPYQGYDASVDPRVSQEFSTAVFRVGHSQVSDTQTGLYNDGSIAYSQTLSESFFNTPDQDEANGAIDSLLRNLSSDHSQATDVYAVNGLRNLLADSPDQMDLIAIDIQRERDLGLGTLNQTRAALGLDPYTSFAQLTDDPTVQANLASSFGSIDEVDLFVGGLAENHAPGADVGSTFQAIIAKQFDALRAGDRFFWQNESFDPTTAKLISQTNLGSIIERNTGTTVEQQNVFVAEQRHASNVAAEDPEGAQLVIGVDDPGATIAGGPADDTIVAGLGLNQILSGGGGQNLFVYNGDGHTDAISDFDPTKDAIQFQPTQTSDPDAVARFQALFHNNQAQVTVSDFTDASGPGASVSFDGNTIKLDGVSASSLQASNFLFPPGDTAKIVIVQPTS